MKTTIACISDLHGKLPETTPECDILVIAGDICPATNHTVHFQSTWMATTFTDWLRKQPAGKIIGTAGNHDWIWQKTPWMVADFLPMTTLIDSSFETRGIKFWGSPWQPPFLNWAFNMPEAGLAKLFAKIPSDIDVLISHGPPFGYGDLVEGGSDGHLGSKSLTSELAHRHIALVICGHIHTGHGIYRMGDTIVVNASCLDERYRQVYKPIMATFEDNRLLSVKQL